MRECEGNMEESLVTTTRTRECTGEREKERGITMEGGEGDARLNRARAPFRAPR